MKIHKEFWLDTGQTNRKPWSEYVEDVDQQDNKIYWDDPEILKKDNAKATVAEAGEWWLHGLDEDLESKFNCYIEFFIKYNLPTTMNLMEVGCGGGRNLVALAGKYAFVGIDHAQGAIDVCEARMPDNEFRCIGAEALPFDNRRFDLIFTETALQHNSCWKLNNILGAIRATIKQNGILWLRNELTIDNVYAQYHPEILPLKPYLTDHRGSHGTSAWWIGLICDHGFQLLNYENSEYVFRRL